MRVGKENIRKINLDDYTVEYCPFCDSEQVVFSKGITACPNCGTSLAPCSMCEDCDYGACPYGCNGSDDEFKEITNPPISKEFVKRIYRFL